MFRFRVRKIPGPLLKFTQKAVLFQDISIFFVLKTELYLSSGTYFFFWKLVFHFTNFFADLFGVGQAYRRTVRTASGMERVLPGSHKRRWLWLAADFHRNWFF